MKKSCSILAAVLCASAICGGSYAVETVTPENAVFDVNRDGSIGARDLVVLMKYIAEARTDSGTGSYDTNGDGRINSLDLVALMRHIAGTAPEKEKTTAEELAELAASHERLEETIADRLPGIVCWGDSLTSGPGGDAMTYPISIQNMINSEITGAYDPLSGLSEDARAIAELTDYSVDIPVINMGVGGETTNTILGRNGAVPFILTQAVTVPADLTRVQIKIKSANGNTVAPLLQGSSTIDNISLGGVMGVLSRGGSKYYFTRYEAGASVDVPTGSPVLTAGYEQYRDYLTVVFMGQNGGFSDYDDLIAQINQIIAHQTRNNDRYIVVGLHTTTPSFREELEDLMYEAFGEKYFNIREYMSSDAIYDAGITPSEDDLHRMQAGYVPRSLLAIDELHFNASGYEILGKRIYSQMKTLGYFDEVISAAGIN